MMEKMTWTRPVAAVEQFMPNEYIATCEDTTSKYFSFVCDAGGGVSGDIWRGGTVANNTITGGTLLTKDFEVFGEVIPGTGAFHACDAKHYVPAADVDATFSNGFYNRGGTTDSTTGSFEPVVIWTGDNDVHATQALKEDIKVVTGNKS